ncbi:MAG: Holliday junction branch migration protein RuvA [Clostridia bacterium]|nr:Holliday junction branch migration protein RuvA [Clostridia bacterium]
MIGFLNGVLRHKYGNNVIIECAGVGYEVMLTNSTFCNMPEIDEEVQIYTYMNLREDGVFLFGFDSIEEKHLFLNLITVSGVGAKTAIQILSGVNKNDLVNSIVGEDASIISNVKGIGKKTAERIILELKDKIDPYEYIIGEKVQISSEMTAVYDAVIVLTSLGISKQQATTLARSVAEKNDSAEQIVSKALKEMGA